MGLAVTRASFLMPAILLGVALLPWRPAGGFGFDLDIGDVTAPAWSADDVQVSVSLLAADEATLRVRAARVRLPEPLGELRDVEFHCPRARIAGRAVLCPRGTGHLHHPLVDNQSFPLSFSYAPAEGLTVSFEELGFAGGRVAGHANGIAADWQVTLSGHAVQLQRLLTLMGETAPASLSVAGPVSFQLALGGNRQGLRTAEGSVGATALEFTNPASTCVGQALAVDLDFAARSNDDGWRIDTEASLEQGQLYLQPWYVAVAEEPLRLTTALHWSPETNSLAVENLSFEQPGVLRLTGDARLPLDDGISAASLAVRTLDARLPAFYETWLQPLLIGSPAGDLITAGSLSGTLDWRAGKLRAAQLTLTRVRLEDRQGRFAIADLDAALAWHDRPIPLNSTLSFGGGHAYGLALGAARLQFTGSGDDLKLAKPTVIPVLDGRLRIDTLSARDFAGADPQWRFDARLDAVSIQALTGALGWPAMAGELSGRLPDLRYADNTLTVGGALRVEVFGGAVDVNALRLESPFGAVPRLSADVRLQDLDLERLTRTFEFGRITGRLEGTIRNLQLVGWQPAAFDATFATPPNDDSRHRISQRAVENLTRLGNGVPGALSAGLLGLFKEFNYDRIGLSCRLKGNICLLGGVAPVKDGRGYYIVKGAGLPRINVIGHNRRVAWRDLLERLRNIDLEQAPVIE